MSLLYYQVFEKQKSNDSNCQIAIFTQVLKKTLHKERFHEAFFKNKTKRSHNV